MSAKKIWIWAVSLPAYVLASECLCVLPGPRFLGGVGEVFAQVLLWLSTFTVYVLVFAVPAVVYYAVRAFVRRKKPGEFVGGLSKSAAWACFVGLWFAATIGGLGVRHLAFVRASRVGDGIVGALAQFKRQTGAYPRELSELVPKYRAEIPYTGMIGYPRFDYMPDQHDIEHIPGEYDLRIRCPSGGLNWDRFLYWPGENYPDRIQGKPVERIRGWAYVHE